MKTSNLREVSSLLNDLQFRIRKFSKAHLYESSVVI